MKSNVTYLGAWLLAVGLAFGLAVASPSDSSVMGRLPDFMAQTLLRQPVTVPQGLPSDRTLALITFQRGKHAEVESWIQGLNLRNDPSITWMRMPVVNDPGTLTGRSEVENRLLQRYTADRERANLVPVFTDRASFVRSAGLNGTDQVYAVVVNRQGEVLARVEGQFDADKAQTLRETLQQRSF
ncbi:hypothetical protein SAMN05216350_104273 [Polaromonas sp. YR568]|uniref:hypothetical protein n=1 Tax=Polaromonas sp. YR568 TaxID=1855301 RepID=UPI0008F1268F|nr:hypothetical protein [Polaromonas sp. YR568]SFU73969.1 hypothetical protein SAMN05216350_104273 [Polaromonas sp. YR568]